MSGLAVSMLGRFCVQWEGQVLPGLDMRKVQELFAYLLLHPGLAHPREGLAGVLWTDSSTDQGRKYLRKTLWQLQTALDVRAPAVSRRLLRVEPDWIALQPQPDLWVDVSVFEQTFAPVEGVPSRELDVESVQRLQQAVILYQGDLLVDCYMDWCLYERERLRQIYLAMLDKLMGYCEAHHEYETGLAYGMRILGCDRASERTHRRMMRLHYLAGDRTGALRQYARCAAALQEELGVRPSRSTRSLYEQIQSDQLDPLPLPDGVAGAAPELPVRQLSDLLTSLHQFRSFLGDLQEQVQTQIDSIQLTLKRRL
jgi:DNA-binding SARP family transcriptional activator